MTTTDSTSTPNPIAASSTTASSSTSTSNGTTTTVKPASSATMAAGKPVSAVPTGQKLTLPATLLPPSSTTAAAATVTSNLKTVTAAPSTTAAAAAGKVPSPILTSGTSTNSTNTATNVRIPCPVAAPTTASSKVVVANTAASTASVKTTAAAALTPAVHTVKTTVPATVNKPVAVTTTSAAAATPVTNNTVSRPKAMTTTTSATTTTAANTANVPTRTSTISVAAPSTIRLQVPNPVSAPVTVPVQIPTSIGQGQVPTPVTIAPNAVGTNTAIVAPSTTTNKISSTMSHVTHHPAKPTTVHSAPTSTTTTTTATTHMATATVKTVSVAQPIHVNKTMTTRKMNQRHVTTTSNTTTTVSPVPSSTTSTRSSKSSPKKKKHKIPMTTTSGGSSNPSASENTGRWTTEEHRLFLQGLEQHGKGWKKIASLIKSRTVVQIRTHAQKYFQKMAKARQNGETTEDTVVSHGGNRVVSHSIHHGSKRKKNGNKRKAIASVVHSVVKERKTKKKKTAAAAASSTVDPVAAPVETQVQSNAEPEGFPVNMVSTVLAPYVYPPVEHDGNGTVVTAETTVPSITTARGTISGAALEESLFRFLTPMPNDYENDVARQAGANSITLPSGNPNKTALDGEVSPAGVVDFPSDWAWSTEAPSWYAKGADIDELLNEADALDWLADTGDLQEAYTPPDPTKMTSEPSLMSLVENPSTASVVATSTAEGNNEPMHKEHVAIKTEEVAAPIPVLETSNNMASIASNGNMPLLPSMFDSGNHLAGLKKESSVNERLASSASLFAAATEGADADVDADNFKLLDDHFEDEQAFVTALLDHPNDSSANLTHLGAGYNNHQ